tara:strand:- start:587 stop:1024 length:438 start_codon:yes stop_codon:yes gene_type:complete
VSVEPRDAAIKFEAELRRLSKLQDGGWALTLHANPADSPELLSQLPLKSRCMVALVVMDDHDEPTETPAQRAGRKAVARANMLPRNPNFVRWFSQKYRLPDVDEEFEDVFREYLRVESRSELKTDVGAQGRLNRLIAEFVKSGQR